MMRDMGAHYGGLEATGFGYEPKPWSGWFMTDAERIAVELRGLLGFACRLGLDEATVPKIYEAVGQEAAAAGACDDERLAEVR